MPFGHELGWWLLAGTSNWRRWGPSVRDVIPKGLQLQPGAEGQVRTVFGFRLPFRITEYSEGRSWRWAVAGVPATGHLIEPHHLQGHCTVTFLVPAWCAPYALVCHLALRRIQRVGLSVERRRSQQECITDRS